MTKTKIKLVAVLISIVLITLSFIYGSVAYFVDVIVAGDGNSAISSGYASSEIIDVTLPEGADEPITGSAPIKIVPGHSVLKNVSARNNGSYPLYVRAKLDYNIELSEQNAGRESEIDLSLVNVDIDTENWEYRDGSYYYLHALLCDEVTTEFISSVSFSTDMGNLYKNSRIYLNVRIEVVQASSNGESVFDAVGWPSDGGGDS